MYEYSRLLSTKKKETSVAHRDMAEFHNIMMNQKLNISWRERVLA
jgi:hypothetical protein